MDVTIAVKHAVRQLTFGVIKKILNGFGDLAVALGDDFLRFVTTAQFINPERFFYTGSIRVYAD
jgi:hypothetical protein